MSTRIRQLFRSAEAQLPRPLQDMMQYRIVRFLIVGSVGFVVNAGVLYLLHQRFKLPLLGAQIIAGEIAIMVTFSFHDEWTYADEHSGATFARFLKFNVSALMGMLITTVILWTLAEQYHVEYLLALSVGAVAALIWNYTMNKLVIWTKKAGNTKN